MELNKFVQHTLVSIMEGIKGAQDKLGDSHARICPTLSDAITQGGSNEYIGLNMKGRAISSIDFDVAVEASTEKGIDGGITVLGGWFYSKLKTDAKKSDNVVTRIRFKIPVCYPDIAD